VEEFGRLQVYKTCTIAPTVTITYYPTCLTDANFDHNTITAI